MSNPDPTTNTDKERSALTTKTMKAPIHFTKPEQITSTHVDNTLVAIDHSSQTVTLTLMSSHPVPKFSDGWNLDTFQMDIVGEIKMPVTAMNQLAIYYMTAISGGVDVLRLIQMEMQRQAKHPPANGFSYGPFGWSQTKEQPVDKQ